MTIVNVKAQKLPPVKQFREHGHLFWPDLWGKRHPNPSLNIQPRLLEALNLSKAYKFALDTESGQILVDRRRCFSALVLSWILNSGIHDYCYCYCCCCC